MSDETIARLFARLDDVVQMLSEVRAAQSRLEERVHYTIKEVDGLKDGLEDKINEALIRINNLEDEITAFKGWIKGTYIALAVSAGVVFWILTQTGVLSRVFGG